MLDRMPALDEDGGREQEPSDAREPQPRPAVRVAQRERAEVEQEEQDGIEDEMVPLQIQEEDDPARGRSGQPEIPVLVDL
jgi:hypothetical protein